MHKEPTASAPSMCADGVRVHVLLECDAKLLEYLRTARAKPLHGRVRVTECQISGAGEENATSQPFSKESSRGSASFEEHTWKESVSSARPKRRKTLLGSRNWKRLAMCALSTTKDLLLVAGEGVSRVGFCWAMGAGYAVNKASFSTF